MTFKSLAAKCPATSLRFHPSQWTQTAVALGLNTSDPGMMQWEMLRLITKQQALQPSTGAVTITLCAVCFTKPSTSLAAVNSCKIKTSQRTSLPKSSRKLPKLETLIPKTFQEKILNVPCFGGSRDGNHLLSSIP